MLSLHGENSQGLLGGLCNLRIFMSTKTLNFRLDALVANIRQYGQHNWQTLALAQGFFKKGFSQPTRLRQRDPRNGAEILIV